MTLATRAGARIPHLTVFEVADFALGGGAASATFPGAGDSLGWQMGQWPDATVYTWNSVGNVLTPYEDWLAMRRTTEQGSSLLYADVLAVPSIAVRVTVVSGTLSSGGADRWCDMSYGPWLWFTNSGGSPGETATCVMTFEIALVNPGADILIGIVAAEDIGATVASGTYTLTNSRT